jgi:CubicO group peptidase (beta-lactamase class C family)
MNKSLAVVALLVGCSSSSTTPARWSRFDAYDQGNQPGIAVMVLRNGEVVEQRGFGHSNRKSGERITPDTAFNLASDSKQMTAAAVLLLEERGKLHDDDTLASLLPGLPAWAADVKVANLIHHTGGLPDYMSICDSGRGRYQTNADVLEFLKTQPKLVHPPGTVYEYSNTGYATLALVVAAAAGEPFPAFMQREIFDKLGMTETWIESEENVAKIPHRAIGYGAWPNFDEKDESDCNYIYGDGTVYTTLRDEAKWLASWRTPGALLSADSIRKAWSPATLDDGTPFGYGYGWQVATVNGRDYVWHDGAWLGFRSSIVNYPNEGISTVVLSNCKATDVDAASDEAAAPFLSTRDLRWRAARVH